MFSSGRGDPIISENAALSGHYFGNGFGTLNNSEGSSWRISGARSKMVVSSSNGMDEPDKSFIINANKWLHEAIARILFSGSEPHPKMRESSG
jgi:hypothetical protein